MACFLVSAAEAVVVTVAKKVVEKKEQNTDTNEKTESGEITIPLSRKLKWLEYMLWGGSFLLMFEHVWHGEVVPWFPFLTAASDPGDLAEMLHEMSTVGVTMAALVTVVWIGMCIASNVIAKRSSKTEESGEQAD